MQTFNSAHTPVRVVHHPSALHGTIQRAAHAGPILRKGRAQQRTVQERVEGWVAVRGTHETYWPRSRLQDAPLSQDGPWARSCSAS